MAKNIKQLSDFTDYFKVGDEVLFGKFKNSRGVIVGISLDQWGSPMLEIEPTPKGRKKNKLIGLFRVWQGNIRG